MTATTKKPRLFNYRVAWRGPWDGPGRPERILQPLRAKNMKEAEKLHDKLFPAKTRKITRVK